MNMNNYRDIKLNTLTTREAAKQQVPAAELNKSSILARDLYLQLLGLALSLELGPVTKQLDQRILGQQLVQRMQLLEKLQ